MSEVKSFQTVFDETVIFFNTFMCEDRRLEVTKDDIFNGLYMVLGSYTDSLGAHYDLLFQLIETSEAIEIIEGDGIIFKGLGFKTDLKALNQKLRDEQEKENEGGE